MVRLTYNVVRTTLPVVKQHEIRRMKRRRIDTHPGEILLKKFLEPLALSSHALAMALRVPANRIGAIIKGERAVTADTALRLARHLRTSPEFWLNLQTRYDLTKARAALGSTILRDVRPRGS
jgi:addiction module HigA family antidote